MYKELGISESETSENLKAGFNTCGLVPINPNKVLDKLPDGTKSVESPRKSSSRVSEVVVGMLKRMRGVDGDDENKRKRRKKIDVPPGQSISYEDFVQSAQGPSTSTEVEDDVRPSTSTEVEDSVYLEEEDALTGSEDDSVSVPKHMKKSEVVVGEYVVVNYEGSEFPGLVILLEDTGAVVRVTQKCIKHGWKWPNKCDELLYTWDNILLPLKSV